MTENYRGYEIRTYETMGIGCGTYYEAWKDGIMWGFAADFRSIQIMIDRMIGRA